jgi:peroxiredoxin
VARHPAFPDTIEEFATMRKLFLSLLGLALIASPALAGKFNTKVSVGDQAPTFSGIPAVMGQQDASVSLSDIKEPVVVLVFLGNHCPVVKAYDDRIIDFTNDYKGKGVKVVGVSVNDLDADRLPAIKDYVKDKGINYVYGYDESQQIGRAYGATNTPQFFVLDKDRKIRYLGAMDDSQNESNVKKTYLRDAVDAVLKGETPAVEETQPKGCGVMYKRR